MVFFQSHKTNYNIIMIINKSYNQEGSPHAKLESMANLL